MSTKGPVQEYSCVHAVVWLFVMLETVTCQAPLLGILQTRVLERIAISSSRGSSQPRAQTVSPCIGRQILYQWATWEVPYKCILNTRVFQFSSVAQSCPTLCNLMNQSMPGLPVHHQLLEFTQTHPLSQWGHPAISSSVIPFSSCPQSLLASGSFPMSQLFTWGGQSIGVSASASVLPMNTQDWSPLGWIGWISLQSKGLSRVFSNTTVQKHQFFGTQLSSQSNPHIHTWPLEKP